MAKKKWSSMKVLEPTVKEESQGKPYAWDPRPNIDVKGEDLPAIENWKVGEEYTLTVKVKLERYSEELNSETKKEEKRASLRIVALGEAEDNGKE